MISMRYIVGIAVALLIIFCLGWAYVLRAVNAHQPPVFKSRSQALQEFGYDPKKSLDVSFADVESLVSPLFDPLFVDKTKRNVGFCSGKPIAITEPQFADFNAASFRKGAGVPRAETPSPSHSRKKPAAHGKRSSKAKASKPKVRSSKSRSRKTA